MCFADYYAPVHIQQVPYAALQTVFRKVFDQDTDSIVVRGIADGIGGFIWANVQLSTFDVGWRGAGDGGGRSAALLFMSMSTIDWHGYMPHGLETPCHGGTADGIGGLWG